MLKMFNQSLCDEHFENLREGSSKPVYCSECGFLADYTYDEIPLEVVGFYELKEGMHLCVKCVQLTEGPTGQ